MASLLGPLVAAAQRRKKVVVVRPGRTRVVVRPGHPIRRAVNRTVIVRAPRRAVVVTAPLVFLPVIAFAALAPVAILPPRERLIWQDTERIERDEDWVESNFGVDARADVLYLQVDGRADVDFADVNYENGDVQSIDFNERTYGPGVYRILDIPGKRNVKTVRVVARSKTRETTLRLYLS